MELSSKIRLSFVVTGLVLINETLFYTLSSS